VDPRERAVAKTTMSSPKTLNGELLAQSQVKSGGSIAKVPFIPTFEPEDSAFESSSGFLLDVERSPPSKESRFESSSLSFMMMMSHHGLLCAREE
jgi:hypothetical protein